MTDNPDPIVADEERYGEAQRAHAAALEPDDVDGQAPGAELAVVNPLTGELVELTQPTTELATVLERFDKALAELRDFRAALTDELVKRLDRANKRTATINAGTGVVVELETNAPTQADYRVDVLEAALEELVAAKKLEPSVRDAVITWTKPAAPSKRVDKREANKLLASADPAVVAAAVKARVVTNTNRTLKYAVREGVVDDG